MSADAAAVLRDSAERAAMGWMVGLLATEVFWPRQKPDEDARRDLLFVALRATRTDAEAAGLTGESVVPDADAERRARRGRDRRRGAASGFDA